MARETLIVTEAELRRSLAITPAVIDVVENAFAALARGGVVMPPILSMDLPSANAEVDVKTAYIPGFKGFAIKVSPGFFDNPKKGLPSLNGLMILFSAETGLVEALFLDNGFLTDLRTAAAGAVAARHLAPAVVQTAGLVGTGVQARLQVKAAHMERPFQRLLVWGRDPERARTCAQDLASDLNIGAEVVSSPEVVVRQSQLVVTTTPARDPLVQADWLHPGLHITAMGSDQDGKNELTAACLGTADLYVADRLSQTAIVGELRAALANGTEPRELTELGEVILGTHPGRTAPDQITIADLTGTGAQDTAIATHAFDTLQAAGAGQRIQTAD